MSTPFADALATSARAIAAARNIVAYVDDAWCQCGDHRVERTGDLCPCCDEGTAA